MERLLAAGLPRLLAVVCWIVVALVASPAAAQTPLNEITLAWDAVPGATGYRIYYGTSTLSYPSVVDVGATTQATVSLPTEATPYYLVVKAYDPNGESMEWSREVVGWPRPEIGSVDVQCTIVSGGFRECVATVNGHNFAQTITGSIPYAGVTVTGLNRIDAQQLELSFQIDPSAQAGMADLVLQQAWTVTPGTQPPGDNGETGGTAGPTLPGAVTIGTVMIPPAPQNLRFTN